MQRIQIHMATDQHTENTRGGWSKPVVRLTVIRADGLSAVRIDAHEAKWEAPSAALYGGPVPRFGAVMWVDVFGPVQYRDDTGWKEITP